MARRLHIGGWQVHPEWEILDVAPRPGVDHVGDAKDLSRFPDETFFQVYASHVLEHFDYKDSLLQALKEWYRVLAPGGELFVSVPNMDVLARMFIDRAHFTVHERFEIMRMLFGGHVNEYDYHHVGLNDEMMLDVLAGARFQTASIVDEFRIFQDTSSLRYKGVLISLNMIARK